MVFERPLLAAATSIAGIALGYFAGLAIPFGQALFGPGLRNLSIEEAKGILNSQETGLWVLLCCSIGGAVGLWFGSSKAGRPSA